MEYLNDIDFNNYPKLIVALTGLIALVIKVRESYSSTMHKQGIKLDLEIFELLKANGEFDNEDLKKSIEANITKSINQEEDGLSNFFMGLVLFVGFGWWSIDIFQSNQSFNGWIILTVFCSLIGLSMLLGKVKKEKSKELFFQVGFYDKDNFQYGLIITLLAGIITPILVVKLNGFSFWQFLSGFFFLLGLMTITKNIRRIR